MSGKDDVEMIQVAECLLSVLGIFGVMEPCLAWKDDFINCHYLAQQMWAEVSLE